jgi:hypothetical protein
MTGPYGDLEQDNVESVRVKPDQQRSGRNRDDSQRPPQGVPSLVTASGCIPAATNSWRAPDLARRFELLRHPRKRSAAATTPAKMIAARADTAPSSLDFRKSTRAIERPPRTLYVREQSTDSSPTARRSRPRGRDLYAPCLYIRCTTRTASTSQNSSARPRIPRRPMFSGSRFAENATPSNDRRPGGRLRQGCLTCSRRGTIAWTQFTIRARAPTSAGALLQDLTAAVSPRKLKEGKGRMSSQHRYDGRRAPTRRAPALRPLTPSPPEQESAPGSPELPSNSLGLALLAAMILPTVAWWAILGYMVFVVLAAVA